MKMSKFMVSEFVICGVIALVGFYLLMTLDFSRMFDYLQSSLGLVFKRYY